MRRIFHTSEGTLRLTDANGRLPLDILAQSGGPVPIGIDAHALQDRPAARADAPPCRALLPTRCRV